jgi:hypothetical protein
MLRIMVVVEFLLLKYVIRFEILMVEYSTICKL